MTKAFVVEIPESLLSKVDIQFHKAEACANSVKSVALHSIATTFFRSVGDVSTLLYLPIITTGIAVSDSVLMALQIEALKATGHLDDNPITESAVEEVRIAMKTMWEGTNQELIAG